MKLSERGAIRSAIADGGFNLYPAGKLVDIIKNHFQGDDLTGDFEHAKTVEKISSVKGPEDAISQTLFQRDLAILRGRLSKMEPEYDIESVFGRMMETIPDMAKRYYGIEGFEPTKPQVLEYFFEGYSDMYKTADWSAFNVSRAESEELSVPVGIYFKRSQVAPGMPEYITMHEANHVMQERVASPQGIHHYVPWMDEGFADILGKMMLYRVTHDDALLAKVKNYRTEVDVLDPRKVVYHYGEETAALTLIRGRLPFAKALMRARQRETFAIDWNTFANQIKLGFDPHVAIVKAFTGPNVDAFRKRFERDEKNFRADSDLDQTDLKVIALFLATTPPACLSTKEYMASLWFSDELAKRPNPHYVDPNGIPPNLRDKIAGWNADSIIPCSEISEDVWKKVPALHIKVVMKEAAIPEDLKSATDELSAKYFIIKRKIGNEVVYEPYGGGLPYRLGTGEIRCSY